MGTLVIYRQMYGYISDLCFYKCNGLTIKGINTFMGEAEFYFQFRHKNF